MSKRRQKLTHEDLEAVPELTGTMRLLSEIRTDKLDLHKLTASEAEVSVRNFLQRHVRSSPGKVVHIITGKGSHPDGPAVLPGVVSKLLREEFKRDVAECAGLVGGGGIALRIKG